MTNPVSNAAPSVKENYGGYPVVKDEKGQYSLESPRFFYRNSTLASAQAELNNDVKAVEEYNKKQAAKPATEEKTPAWKLVVFFPFYLGKFVLGTIASLFSKCCALFGYGKKVEEAAKPEQKPAVAPTAAK